MRTLFIGISRKKSGRNLVLQYIAAAKKMLEAIQFCPNSIDICPSYNLPALQGCEKKPCFKFSVKTKKKVFNSNLNRFLTFERVVPLE